jgi:two-component system, cell cycle sensor histidine kinase and response regulator CckA
MAWLFPAVVAAAGAAFLQVIAYFWLWLEERKQFLRTWTLAWLFYLARFIASLLALSYGKHPLLVAAEHGCMLISAVLLLQGLYEFLQKPFPRSWLYIGGVGIAWVVYAAANGLPFMVLSTPVFLLSGGIFLATGIIILRASHLPRIGRLLVGWTFIVWGIHKLDFPFLRPVEWFAPIGFFLGGLLSVVVAMGMILIYFRYTKDLLAQNEARLRFLSNNIPNGAFFQHVLTPDGKITYTYMSDSVEDILGVSAPEVIADANKLRELIYPDDMARLHEAEAESSANRSFLKVEFRQHTPSGQLKWVQYQAAPQRLSAVETVWNGFFFDITERKLAEKALREGEEKYRILVDNLNAGVFAADLSGRFLHANPAVAAMAGYETVEEVMALPTSQLYAHACDRGQILREIRENGSIRNREIRTVRKDGTPYWASLSAVLLNDEAGNPACINGIVENITDRKEAADALRQSEERFRLLFEQCPLGMAMTRLDNRFTMVNPHLCKMIGYTESELTGLTFEDITHPDDIAASVQAAGELASGIRLGYETEKRYIRKDGQTIWINLVVSPVRDKSGKVLHFLSMMQDISEKKRAEAEHLRMVAAIEHAAETIEITDEHGAILYVNPAFEKNIGYSRDEVIGTKSSLLESGQQEAAFHRQVWETISGGRIWSGHLVSKKKNGTLVEEEATISPIKDGSGRIVSYVAVKRDVTHEVLLQKQLLESQKMEAVGTLAGGIAHDFNNLLQVISGYAEMALFDLKQGEAGHSELREIKKAAHTAAELTQGLLTFSRRVESKLRPVSLNKELEQVVKMLERTLPKMIAIRLHLADPLDTVNADPSQLQQVIVNLAVNARDAMPKGGKLVLETQNATLGSEFCKAHLGLQPGRHVLLKVSDTGIGIDQKQRQHIFDPFFTTKEIGKGTGLGLSIAYGIVKNHGGSISCYSALGSGTTFKIYLPAFASGQDPYPRAETALVAGGTETILLVDDEESVRTLAEAILSMFGYSVLTASNGREGLETFLRERHRIDLVILDIIMPEMGGMDCLREIKNVAPRTKVLVASGYAADGHIERALEHGAHAYVSKPYEAKQLLEHVRKVLNAS